MSIEKDIAKTNEVKDLPKVDNSTLDLFSSEFLKPLPKQTAIEVADNAYPPKITLTHNGNPVVMSNGGYPIVVPKK